MAHKKLSKEENTSPVKDSCQSKFLSWFECWNLYVNYSIRNAGFAFACLYMTVLGFDNITYGFCLHQCVSESTLGAMVGISAFVGICASMSYPFLRKRLGLANTGIFGITCLEITLVLGLTSIFLDGSPFHPNYFQHKQIQVLDSEV